MSSLRSMVADLLGDDPYSEGTVATEATERSARAIRPTVREAFRACTRGDVLPARHRGRDVALFVIDDGRVFVTPDNCPHDGGLLSDGFVEGQRLVCTRHGWEFDACSGSCPARDVVIPTRLVGRKP